MEFKTKLEAYKDTVDYRPLNKSECMISIDQSDRCWSSSMVLGGIFRNLCRELSVRLNTRNAKAE